MGEKMKQQINKVFIQTAIFLSMISFTCINVSAQPSLSSSLGVIPFPAQGQSPSQQSKDEGECYTWAKQQTGIDPTAVASAPPPPSGPAVGGGERVKGAARGALGGAAIGAIAGDTGAGAGIGAVAGTMAGGRKARQNQQGQTQQAEDAKAGQLQHFNKAFSACLEGKGYVVK
jgi:hypothetical protein